MATKSVFYPYRVVQQTAGTLQLQPASSPRVMLWILRGLPLIFIVVGVVLSLLNNDPLYLLLLVGMAIVEGIIFSFIRIPSSLKMDSFGFTLQTISLRGTKETDYLWSDVESVSQQAYSAKGGRVVNYRAHLATGKKVTFLSFGNSHLGQEAAQEIAAVVRKLSGKEVQRK